jgi:cobalt-zinc-cadmium efflux system membrane fusion protein
VFFPANKRFSRLLGESLNSGLRFLGLAVVLALAGCGSGSNTNATPPPPAGANSAAATDGEYIAPDSKGVQTITVSESPIPDYLELPAHIEPDPTHVVRVFAPAGGRIVEMKVRPWDHVEKGATLALLDSSDLARAVADYHKARVDNEVKQKALARANDLYDHHAIAEKDFQQAQGDAQMSQAEVDAAREQIKVFGMDPDRATNQLRVAAPRTGIVLDIGAASGEFSTALAAAQPLCTIADISEIWAMGDMYEKDYTAAKPGEAAQVTLNAYPGQHWAGRVSVVSGEVDATTHTLHLRVVLPNPDGRIKPAMFGSIRILRSSANGILVPASAVIREGNHSYVYIGKGNNRYQRRDVTLGRTVDGSMEVVSGLLAGDIIVSEGALLLRSAEQS